LLRLGKQTKQGCFVYGKSHGAGRVAPLHEVEARTLADAWVVAIAGEMHQQIAAVVAVLESPTPTGSPERCGGRAACRSPAGAQQLRPAFRPEDLEPPTPPARRPLIR
jgi:hypothetical protein